MALLLSFVGCGELARAPAIRLGDRSLTVEDLRTAYADLDPAARPPLATREDRRAFARRVVERLLLVEEGRRLQAADSAGGAAADSSRDARLILVRRLRVLGVGARSVDSAAVVQAWERMQTRHAVRIARFGREEEARGARARLDGGEPFESLLARDIEDAPEAETWVAWSPIPDPVADAVTDLPLGAVAGPMRVGGAWWLVRVDEREPNDTGSIEELRPRILQGLSSRYEMEALDALARQLQAAADVRIVDEAIHLLAARTREAILRPESAEQDEDWALPRLTAAEESTLVAGWQGGTLQAGEYVQLVADESRAQRPRAALEAEVRRTVEQEVVARLLVAEAERRGLGRDWWVRRALQRAADERASQTAVADIERRGAPAATAADSLAELLHAAQPGLFRREARARIVRFDLPDRAAAERERQRIERAGGVQARLEELLDREGGVGASYHLFWMTAAELPTPDTFTTLVEKGPGAVSGPWKLGDLWVVLGCLETKPPSQPDREEVLAELRKRIAATPDPRRITAWVDGRIQERGMSIDEDALDALAPGG